MSLKIKKSSSGEIFDLPSGYVIESEKNNPFFSQKGSQSISIDFPNSDHNRLLLDNANRLDKAVKPTGAIRVVVETEHSQQAGVMVINSASAQAISASIGWDESEMYVHMGATQLRDLPNMPVLDFPGTIDQRITSMLTHLTDVMKETVEADYYVFPIVVKKDVDEKEDAQGNKISQEYFEVLNDYENIKLDANDQPLPSNGAMGELLAWDDRIMPRYMDSEVILFKVPRGYGVSPFIKVWRILELIFDNYGFTLSQNPFKNHRQLRRLVVLNNTMDTILTGRLHYRDMMPDMTVKGFLDALYNKFGMQYFVHSNTRAVSLMFWRDVLATHQSPEDFTRYKTEPPSVSYTVNKQLRLSANREIEGAAVRYNTFEEFLDKYGFQFSETNAFTPYNPQITSVFNTQLRTYLMTEYYKGTQIISSDFFDWDKKADLPCEEIKMTDLSVPLNVYKKHGVLFYLTGIKHAWSDISVSGENIEPDQKTTKLAFAFGWGNTKLQENPLPEFVTAFRFNYFYASQDNRDVWGRFISDPLYGRYDLSLTCHREDGLFNRFWKEYDAFLRHSNFEVTAKLKIPENEIIRLNMFQTVFIDFQPFLPETIRFKQNKPEEIAEFRLRTMRLYEPFDLASEHAIPVYTPQLYFWEITIVVSPVEQHWIDSGYAYYINGMSIEEYTMKIAMFMLPPTEEEYLNHLTRTMTLNYTIGYPASDAGIPSWRTITFTPRKIT